MSIIDALKGDSVRNDPLFRAARIVSESDLPTDAAAAIVKHIHDARTKHPVKPPTKNAEPGGVPYDRMDGVAAKVAEAAAKKGKAKS